MAGWNLALRFLLELVALAGLAAATYNPDVPVTCLGAKLGLVVADGDHGETLSAQVRCGWAEGERWKVVRSGFGVVGGRGRRA